MNILEWKHQKSCLSDFGQGIQKLKNRETLQTKEMYERARGGIFKQSGYKKVSKSGRKSNVIICKNFWKIPCHQNIIIQLLGKHKLSTSTTRMNGSVDTSV